MTEYLPSLQTYTFAAASVYFTWMTGVSMYNKVKFYLEDRRWAKIIDAQEAEIAKEVEVSKTNG